MSWAKYAGFLALAYLVYTTMNGNLSKWLQIIGLKPDGNAGSGFSFSDKLAPVFRSVNSGLGLRGKN